LGIGQVEIALEILKTMLQQTFDKKRSNWHHIIFSILLAYRSSINTTTKFTPFHPIHGVEVVLPIKCEIPSIHIVIELLPNTFILE
jgi:hypothetical protein